MTWSYMWSGCYQPSWTCTRWSYSHPAVWSSAASSRYETWLSSLPIPQAWTGGCRPPERLDREWRFFISFKNSLDAQPFWVWRVHFHCWSTLKALCSWSFQFQSSFWQKLCHFKHGHNNRFFLFKWDLVRLHIPQLKVKQIELDFHTKLLLTYVIQNVNQYLKSYYVCFVCLRMPRLESCLHISVKLHLHKYQTIIPF